MKQQTAVEWLIEQYNLYRPGQMPRTTFKKVCEQAKQMEKEREKKIAIHFMVLGIKNKGDYSKIDFYKEIEKL